MQNKALLITVLLSLFNGLISASARIAVGPGGTTYTDCSAATINTAISSAVDGDTVLLTCAGTVTWTSTVSIPSTKGITLQVQGGTNTPNTSANFPLVVTAASGVQALSVSIGPNNSLTRVSGFRFGPNSGSPDPFMSFSGHGTGKNGLGSFRLDNNYFDTISGVEIIEIYSNNGTMYGLIDNNTFHNDWRASDPSYGPYNIQLWRDWHPSNSSCWGCDGWTNNDFSYGSANFTFIEDNLFEQTATAPAHMRHYISAELGDRYVSRHNTFINNYPDNNADLLDAHGMCLVASNGVGSRGGEIYANVIQGTGYNRAMQLRGGSWLIYDNTITPSGGNSIEFDEYRAGDSNMYSQCSSSASALSSTMPPWPVPTGARWNPNAPWKQQAAGDGSDWPLPLQIFNTYAWNNVSSGGVLINPAVLNHGTGDVEATYIQKNRDYFASATKPTALTNYAPYTYPHPLQASTVGSVTPPTGLTATVQ